MSIAFNVSFNNTSKKLSISKMLSIGDLVSQCCDKFAIAGGELFYNNKKLDASLPIRFSSLINNCKLVLKEKQLQEKVISIKIHYPGGTAIKKLSNTIALSALVAELLLEVDNLAMGYMSKTIVVKDNIEKRLSDIVGDADNLVLRFNVVKDTAEEQRKIVEQQVQEQKAREMKKREREEQEREERLAQEKKQRELEAGEDGMDVDSAESSVEPVPGTETTRGETKVETNIETSVVLDPVVKDDTLNSRSLDSTFADSTRKLSQQVDREMMSNIDVSDKQEDIIYEPSDTKHYENPDEDYEFTANHAKLYQNSIRYKLPKKTGPVEKKEAIYKIRIKFPNNYILEIQINNTQKFGELIKKIDSHLTEDFKSNYNLKLSYPPFKKFEISFALNGEKLIDIAEFSSQLLLIFESKIPAKGTEYLNNQENHKKFSEMPEVQLEENRSSLPDEQSASRPTPQSHTSSTSSTTSKTGNKTPRWLKLGK